MLLSRRATALVHASIVQQLPIKNLFARIRGRISDRILGSVLSSPPASVAAYNHQSFPIVENLNYDFSMEKGVEESQVAPAAKRQRTDDGPATKGAAGAGVGAKEHKNGAPMDHRNQKGSGRKKKFDVRIQMMRHAVKRNNLKFAINLFRDLLEENVKMDTSLLNSLMYLACGAEQWERYARGLPLLTAAEAAAEATEADGRPGDAEADGDEGQQQQRPGGQQQQKQRPGRPVMPEVPEPEGPPPTREELVAAVDELWSYMKTAGLQPDQGTYLALARREALQGDPEGALQWVQECGKKGKPVQLRLFHPAQVGYCLRSDVEKVHAIDTMIASHSLDNTEYEFARLLEVIAAAGTYAHLRAVLMRMQTDLNELAPSTVDYIAAFFEGNPAAQQAFAPVDQGGCPGVAQRPAGAGDTAEASAGPGSWQWEVVRDAAVTETGWCAAADASVKVVDLEDKDWEAFVTAIAQLARTNMGNRAADFDSYVQWYERNGPYDILVDAANVAFYAQNREGGGFNWRQVQHMYELLRQRFPGKKILVMVHRKRTQDEVAQAPGVPEFLGLLRRNKSFYYTPPGANDDWFWLYACVRAKHNGLLVSNDELRDHIFSLLRPKHFLKWKERHIAHYSYVSHNPNATATAQLGQLFKLELPRPYTACVQQLAESGAWMVPINNGTWLCVRPVRAA
ncbi:hypothetical protein Vretimale_15878 [Volvox reticuliferus]|uniref:Mitochondrial ribonuclease P catalytic subunit n=1 Tax=Volvox reticuliferus TaxID=1737510 RepID=A0A8J4GRP2_9CHLO|nr:hypothetical protein Vretifemale_12942 [Volvox reticuliferus]GIM12562.1 hypothetical protein Vretimale_15878 [Volvox reticuliferus]